MSDPHGDSPLTRSLLWQGMTACMAQDASRFATPLHYFTHLFLDDRNRHEWQNGILVDARDAAIDHTDHDKPFHAPRRGPEQDDALKTALAALPDIPQYKAAQLQRPVTGMTGCSSMPMNTDVHHLAAAVMTMKHAFLNPGCLAPENSAAQRDILRQGLHAGLDIAARRGIQEEFANSCAAFAWLAPKISPTWESEQNKIEEARAAAMAAMQHLSPSGRQKLARSLRQSFADAGITPPLPPRVKHKGYGFGGR